MYIGFVIALICAFAALGSGLGYRAGLWHFRTGIEILKWSFFRFSCDAFVSFSLRVFLKGEDYVGFDCGDFRNCHFRNIGLCAL